MMKRGTLIALGLTAGTIALVASRRRPEKDDAGAKGSGKDATENAPADSQATPDTAKAPPPFRESDLSSKQPWNRFRKPGYPPPPQISPQEEAGLLRQYDVLANAEPNSVNPDELVALAARLRPLGYENAANYLMQRADLARTLRALASSQNAPPGGAPLGSPASGHAVAYPRTRL